VASYPTGCGVLAGSGEPESSVQCYTVLWSVIQCVESRVMSSAEIHKRRGAITRFP
jgi:hypothetical protein